MTYMECNQSASVILHPGAFHAYAVCRKLRAMSGPYLKQWRSHLGLTQKQVVDRLAEFDDDALPGTEASLSRIENGNQVWGQRIMEALAHIYGVTTEDLMTRDPIEEAARAAALAKGGKVVSFKDFTVMSDLEKQRLVRMWNAIEGRDEGRESA